MKNFNAVLYGSTHRIILITGKKRKLSRRNNNEGHTISDDPQENEINNADNLVTEEFSEEHVENAPESDEQQ